MSKIPPKKPTPPTAQKPLKPSNNSEIGSSRSGKILNEQVPPKDKPKKS